MFIKSKFTHVAYARLDRDDRDGSTCEVCVAELIGHLNSGELVVADKGFFRVFFDLNRTSGAFFDLNRTPGDESLVWIDGPFHGNAGKVLKPSLVDHDKVFYIEGAEAAKEWLQEEFNRALDMMSFEDDLEMAVAVCADYRDQFQANERNCYAYGHRSGKLDDQRRPKAVKA